ncbi:MAG TPA: hypothetical protein VMT20_13695 [Terriglobia bacterium]|nr:hypothetical protein [Terriglobia bacterium]
MGRTVAQTPTSRLRLLLAPRANTAAAIAPIREPPQEHGVYVVVNPLTATLLLWGMVAAQGSASLPWIFPGDFRERLRISDLVVSGMIEHTSRVGGRVVDGTDVTANIAHFRVDRVFQRSAAGEKLQRFTWFTLRVSTTGRGFAYSGPPLADFRSGKRYLVFLKRAGSGWEVAMPVYAIEEELAATPPGGALRDLSQVSIQRRYQGLAEELENAALAQPVPPPGMTGESASFFPSIFDLLGGCAERFYRRFLSSPSPELRDAAATWLRLIRSRHLACKEPFAPESNSSFFQRGGALMMRPRHSLTTLSTNGFPAAA